LIGYLDELAMVFELTFRNQPEI